MTDAEVLDMIGGIIAETVDGEDVPHYADLVDALAALEAALAMRDQAGGE